MRFAIRSTVLLIAFLLITYPVSASDDAEILSRRVPDQIYYVVGTASILERGKGKWLIPLWACDPATLTIIKVLGGSAPAPYAIKITPRGNNPISSGPNRGRLRTIHLLAASLVDAVKMRRALLAETEAIQRRIEEQQGNAPGFLKRVVESMK